MQRGVTEKMGKLIPDLIFHPTGMGSKKNRGKTL